MTNVCKIKVDHIAKELSRQYVLKENERLSHGTKVTYSLVATD